MIHFLYTPFTGLGLFGGYRGKTWLKNRIKIFKQFTLQGLLNQSNQDFYLWLSFRPEDEENPIVQDFIEHLGKLQLKGVIATYNGIMFWDDKYPDEIAETRLRTSLYKTLPQLKELVGKKNVLMTLQPSDDVYLSDAVERIQKADCSLGFSKGYMMNYSTLELAEYNPETLPPFTTIKFTAEQFLNPNLHYNHTGAYQSHEYVPIDKKIDKRMFIVGTHGENISTTWMHEYMGMKLGEQLAEDVMINSGLFGVEPIEVKKDLSRRVKKRIINILPKPMQRAIIKAQSPGVNGAIKKYNHFSL